MSVQLAKDNLLFRLSLFTERRTIKDNVATIKRKKETNPNNNSVRSDYYPFNQTFLDDYYRRWEAENSKN